VLSTANDTLSVEAIGWTLLRRLPLTSLSALRFAHEIIGLGASLAADDQAGTVRITKVFPNSPAQQAGVTAGLIIQSINGRSVAGKSTSECLQLLAGPLGAEERLELVNPERTKTNSFALRRQRYVLSF
jgi:C-terminal processing protease CtpA/Prc